MPCRLYALRPAMRGCVRPISTLPGPGCHTGARAEDQSGTSGSGVFSTSSPSPWLAPAHTPWEDASGTDCVGAVSGTHRTGARTGPVALPVHGGFGGGCQWGVPVCGVAANCTAFGEGCAWIGRS